MQGIAALTLFGLIISPSQAPSSADLARDLTGLMKQQQRDVIAVEHPGDPGRFIAAMNLNGTQLLVISAKYSVPVLLKEMIARDNARQVYLDLHSAADLKGRFFVQDMGADGLHTDGDASRPTDITWRDGTLQTIYNSDWKAQKLSEAEYQKRAKADAAEYTELLSLLKTAATSTAR